MGILVTVDSTNRDPFTRYDSNGKAYVYCYATSGAIANTPAAVNMGLDVANGASGWKVSPIYDADGSSTKIQNIVGVPEASMASGCCGWVQIKGAVTDMQNATGSAAQFTGSIGHALIWSTDGVYANASTYTAGIQQFAWLTEAANGSTTSSIYLDGRWVCGA